MSTVAKRMQGQKSNEANVFFGCCYSGSGKSTNLTQTIKFRVAY